MQAVLKFDDIKNSELQQKVYDVAFRIIKEFKITKDEFQKALEYYNYVLSDKTTLDNIINRNELTLREFETLKLLIELNEYAEQKNIEIVSMTTLIKSVEKIF